MRNSPRSKNAEDRTDGPLDVLDLYRLAEEQNVPVYWYPLQDSPLESFVVELEDGGCAIALDPLKLRSLGDEKYKLAHELGHGLTGALYCRSTPLDERGRNETRADRWAIHRLLPFEDLKAALDQGITETAELAEHFQLPGDLIEKAVALYTGPEGRCFTGMTSEA